MNNSFYKAIILTYLKDKKYLTSSKVSCLETSLFTRYNVSYRARNWPEKFRGFREKEKRTLTAVPWELTRSAMSLLTCFLFALLPEKDYDYVEIRDGEKDYSQLLTPSGGLTGNLNYTVTASSNVMWIKFVSDSSVNARGFNLTYEALGMDAVLLHS